jgi:poly(A) polymerase
MLLRDNVFGNQEEDAARRDFTVNALYYDPEKQEVWDWHGGVEDAKKVLRMIGDPANALREDPVRMLRAARFAAKLEFHIDPATRAPIAELAPMLERIPLGAPVRRNDEAAALRAMPSAASASCAPRACITASCRCSTPSWTTPDRQKFLHAALHDTDERIRQGHSASPAFMLACLLWFDMQAEWRRNKDTGQSAQQSPSTTPWTRYWNASARPRLPAPLRRHHQGNLGTAIPLRATQRRRPFRLLDHPRFRAGYDFLLIRSRGGDASEELADWWTRFQDADADEQARMLLPAQSGDAKRKRRRRRSNTTPGDAVEVKLG